MTPERHKQLMDDTTMHLTIEEMQEGWHFCPDWDGALIKIDTETCPCEEWTKDEIEAARLVADKA